MAHDSRYPIFPWFGSLFTLFFFWFELSCFYDQLGRCVSNHVAPHPKQSSAICDSLCWSCNKKYIYFTGKKKTAASYAFKGRANEGVPGDYQTESQGNISAVLHRHLLFFVTFNKTQWLLKCKQQGLFVQLAHLGTEMADYLSRAFVSELNELSFHSCFKLTLCQFSIWRTRMMRPKSRQLVLC